MPTPGTFPSTTAISFSQVNTEFGLTTPSPMNLKYRFAPGTYTPALNPIPTTPGPSTPASLATFPMDVLHGRTKAVAPFITSYTHPNPAATTPYTTTWTSTVTGNIKVLTVGGGGGGASGANRAGGGGGGGGVCYNSAFPVVNGTVYNIAVGHGGVAGIWPGAAPTLANGVNGGNSSFSTVVGLGGGYGSCNFSSASPGGSGGGGGQDTRPGGGGPVVNPVATQPTSGSPGTNYGNVGARGRPAFYRGGGGGGAGAAATTVPTSVNSGGAGIANSITGAAVTYAGGGGGAYQTSANAAGVGGAGGAGGGGAGSNGNANATPGTNNLGGGGGGGTSGTAVWAGGRGGNGIVIIAYP